jgi:hypothetical protein
VANRVGLGAFVGAVLAIPALWLLPCLLWGLEQWLKPGPPTALEESAMGMSVMTLLFAAILCGPPLGAAVGASWVARRLRRPRIAGTWCVACGLATAAGLALICLSSPDPRDQVVLMLLPWRAGHLLYALLLSAWGIGALRKDVSSKALRAR